MPHDVGMIRVMEAFFASPDEGEWLDTALRSHRLLAQFPDLEVIDSVFEPGWEGVDPHVHDDHTDSFYVLEGEVEFLQDGEWHRAGAGTFLSVPPNVEHGFRPCGSSFRLLNFHTPNTGFIGRLRD